MQQGETFAVDGRKLAVNALEAEHGIVDVVEVTYDRAVMIVTKWRDGMTIVGTFCGGGSPEVARAKARQRAMQNGLRLRTRWALASDAAE